MNFIGDIEPTDYIYALFSVWNGEHWVPVSSQTDAYAFSTYLKEIHKHPEGT